MSKNTQPVLLTVKEVSQLLRIHRPKVYDLIRDGTIEGFKLGSDWRVKRESIEKLVGLIPDEFFNKKGVRSTNSASIQSKAA
jgi:excisionase family DNA binding protein